MEKSEWRVRKEAGFLKNPAWQVYRLKDSRKSDVLDNREVHCNYSTREYAEVVAQMKNDELEAQEIREERIENNAER